MLRQGLVGTLICWCMVLLAPKARGESLTPRVEIFPGAINEVLISDGDLRLAVYGASNQRAEGVERVLLVHGRRDLVRAAKPLIRRGIPLTAPARAEYWLSQPDRFWSDFRQQRFHDYAQQTTKIMAEPVSVEQWVNEDDRVAWRDLIFRVLETPGYTRDSITYLLEVDEQKLAFTGDLIYAGGKLLDLYSFQDAIPAAQIRGYHGYGSRLADLVGSLERLAAEQPAMLIPARGPVIRQPQVAIEQLVRRVQALYRNYLSTNALHWYFKEERMRACGQRILGEDAKIELMPYAHHEAAPNWVYENSTSRLLISESGHAFLLDCGYDRVMEALRDLMEKRVIEKIDGIFVTHYHDDHTDAVQAAAEAFGCPVYATPEYADVLENPAAYHLPAMTANPIRDVRAMRHGSKLNWREFELTFLYFPGQTYYHGGLLVQKADSRPILFVGDAFAPSGFDDYCVQNRNLLHEDSGYLFCLKQIEQLPDDCWLVNEHIPHVFEFSASELSDLEARYRERIALQRELFPWDDPNYGVDEQWAVFYPYGVTLEPGGRQDLQLRITNHSPKPRTFRIQAHGSPGVRLVDGTKGELQLAPREMRSVSFVAEVPAVAGTYLVTADVESDGMQFHDWAEAMLTVATRQDE